MNRNLHNRLDKLEQKAGINGPPEPIVCWTKKSFQRLRKRFDGLRRLIQVFLRRILLFRSSGVDGARQPVGEDLKRGAA